MTITAPRTYRKRPVEIAALQWLGNDWGDHLDAMLEFTDEITEREDGRHLCRTLFMALPSDDADEVLGGQEAQSRREAGYSAVICDDLHGTWVNVSTRDWIIRGVQGEFYPCQPDVFAETYQLAELG